MHLDRDGVDSGDSSQGGEAVIEKIAHVVLVAGRLRLCVAGIYLATEADLCRHSFPDDIAEKNLQLLTESYGDNLLARNVANKWNQYTLEWAADQINHANGW